MSSFDYVNVKVECPHCGNDVIGFQSKDNVCGMGVIDPKFVNNFYTDCDYCGRYIEFSRYELLAPTKPRKQPFTLAELTEMGFTLMGVKSD